ncbi:MAG: serine/threonine protein kinase [Deltaproteobacteria bacterium]|nr:MAG: serine/threonine protein kinase [Deltaproteobacteria bacterium]
MVGELAPKTIGRYALFGEIASGGMATVHLGRLIGAAGFSRVVAIKRLHHQYVRDPDFVSMLIDEARVAARIRHPNVVPTLDVVNTDGELFLVMEYVQGESLARLLKATRAHEQPVDPGVAVAIVAGVLHGLHAAHTALGEQGEALGIVHRDVSPQNVMVGSDGVPRVLDFGIAKATGRVQTTKEGQIKGKLAYMAPEQLAGDAVGPYTDVYAASLVLWEILAGRRTFQANQEAELFGQVLLGASKPPSHYNPKVSDALDELVMRGLARNHHDRYASAREMALALEETGTFTTATKIGAWVEDVAPAALSARADRISLIESKPKLDGAPLDSIDELSGEHEGPLGTGAGARPTQRSVGDSQLSSISVARSRSSILPQRGNRLGAIGLGALALVAGGLLAVAWLRDGGEAETTTERGETTESRAAAGPTGVPDIDGPTEGDEQGPDSAAPTPSASATPEPSVTASASASTPKPRPPTPHQTAPPPRPKPPPRSNCVPPYTVDSEGIRHIKPECVN